MSNPSMSKIAPAKGPQGPRRPAARPPATLASLTRAHPSNAPVGTSDAPTKQALLSLAGRCKSPPIARRTRERGPSSALEAGPKPPRPDPERRSVIRQGPSESRPKRGYDAVWHVECKVTQVKKEVCNEPNRHRPEERNYQKPRTPSDPARPASRAA